MAGISERYADKIDGVLGCFDRMIITGTLPTLCYADGMTSYLSARGMRIFDFVKLVQPLTEAIKANAEALAAEAGLKIDYIRKKNFRKQDRVKAVIEQRGDHPGLGWVFSALQPGTTYPPWHDKPSGRSFLRYKDGQCLHYYFYFIDGELGRCYVPVPSWRPFRLQFYSNGHNWLARQLQREGSGYRMARQRLCRDRELGAGATDRRQLPARTTAPPTGRVRAKLLPDLCGDRVAVALESGHGRIGQR